MATHWEPPECLGLPLSEDIHSCLPKEKPFLTGSLSWLTWTLAVGLGDHNRSPQSASCFWTGRVAKSSKILILDLKTTCMKENRRMAVPSLVPAIIPVLKLLILTPNPWRFKHGIHFSANWQLLRYLPNPWQHLQQNNARAFALLERLCDGWQSALLADFQGRRLLPEPRGFSLWRPELPLRTLIPGRRAGLCHRPPEVATALNQPAAPSMHQTLAGPVGKEILIDQRLGGSVV